MATLVCAQLLFLEAENFRKKINRDLHSTHPGLVWSQAGMAIYDTMQFFRPASFDTVHRPGLRPWGRCPVDRLATRTCVIANANARIHGLQPSGGFRRQASRTSNVSRAQGHFHQDEAPVERHLCHATPDRITKQSRMTFGSRSTYDVPMKR